MLDLTHLCVADFFFIVLSKNMRCKLRQSSIYDKQKGDQTVQLRTSPNL